MLVEGAEELTNLSVELRSCSPGEATKLLDSLGRLDDAYAWLRMDALRDLAGPPHTPGWDGRFDEAMAYAQSKGWTDPTGLFVRAHLDHPVPTATDETGTDHPL